MADPPLVIDRPYQCHKKWSLYLFQNIPIFLPKAFFFKTLDSITMSFIWEYKTHRIGKKHFCKSKDSGGLALPVFQHYYWAANARALVYWQDAYPGELKDVTPPWVAMEQNVQDTSLPATCSKPAS